LLIVALGGVAFYYFSGLPEPPAPAPMRAQKQPIVVPPRAAEAVPAPAAPSQEPAPDSSLVEKPAVAAVAAASAPALAGSGAPSSVPLTVPSPAPIPAAGFVLDAGTFLLPSSWTGVETKVRKLGFEPHLQPVQRTVPMTRLKLGTYPPAEARNKLAELAPTVPDAFVVTRDGQSTLYAGSYLDLDRARSFADKLYAQGVTVDEEATTVPRTLQRVTFGTFPDRDTADQAAAKARAARLPVTVVKSR
jgi:hypothetical protein